DGLDGTELAISESQERMAVVVEAMDCDKFITLANKENLEATVVAKVKAEKRLTMCWNGKNIVDISREFLNSNGAEKHIKITISKSECYDKNTEGSFVDKYKELAGDLNVCSKRGLSERFDSTIGSNTVLMPFGGKYQITPAQAMAAKIPLLDKETTTCSVMAWGYNPFITSKSPYHGAYLAVVESVSKLVTTGATLDNCYLTFQEYFEKPMQDPKRWGKPLAALLGAFDAQLDFGFGAIGGKDSMSGTFENIDVPPTLVSFAITLGNVNNIISPEFKKAGSTVKLVSVPYNENGLPDAKELLKIAEQIAKLIADKKIISAYTPTYGGIAEAIMKMSFGNKIGFEFENISVDELFKYSYGSFILEVNEDIEIGKTIGKTTENYTLKLGNDIIELSELENIYEDKLEDIYPANITQNIKKPEVISYNAKSVISPKIKVSKPKVLIPAFPGTNCEYDTAKRLIMAGAEPEIFVINNLSSQGVAESVNEFAKKIDNSQIIFIPGGFSGGDEPDGSGKFITAFFRNPKISESVNNLLKNRDGLMAGICNGFQALVKLGLVPFGEIIEANENCPTLTYNIIGRHQSRLVRTRIASNKSPWLAETNVGDVYTVAISHGEGRFICNDELLDKMIENGQVATQYVDLDNNPTSDIAFNPNGSVMAIEGITSPDGRVIGKMGHSERIGNGLYKNVIGEYDLKMFESAVKYFK
ncbi:MAG: phosphoribosylformylglycinamidine synthase subunit PurQ, partial [Clostridia bacterium]|nr:phosphoribosylformylglycinamidine synthase subunit PurQ [Clostridia bacterium]